MKKLASILSAVAILFALTATPVAGQGYDPRCGGRYGIQVWENAWYGGRTYTFCSADGHSIGVGDLSSQHQNLNSWESWNDRISSSEVFNANTGFNQASLFLYSNAGFTGPGIMTNYNNNSIAYYGGYYIGQFGWGSSGANDKASSITGYSY